MLVYNNILEGYKAREMAEEYNVSEPQAAKEYFEETFEYDDFNEENIKNKKFICNIHNINCDMYYDYGSDYYFLVKENGPMKQQLSLNEKTLKKIIKESVKRVLKESTFSLSPNEIRELVESAKEYESGDMEIWAEENCPDEIYPNDYDTCLKIWLKAHKEDIPYYQ